jgi:putative colanic acid biosynthesis acetyltransferase WcaB
VIIGAGSVVIKDIPAGCVAVGNPARVLEEKKPVKQHS